MTSDQLRKKIQKQIDIIEAWASKQQNVRLVLGQALSDAEIDMIPTLIKSRGRKNTPDVYSPEQFQIPDSYREFLRLCGSAHLEYYDKSRSEWIADTPFILSPEKIAEETFTVWLAEGETSEDDDREVSTTEFIPFAMGGYNSYDNHWCFFTGHKKGNELPVYFLDNHYEFLIGRYAGTNEWMCPEYKKPAFPGFIAWFEGYVKWLVKEPYDFDGIREWNSW